MRITEKVKETFWLEIAKSCPYATYFHTPYWAELMTKTFFYIDITKGFIFDDGTRVIFPFMRIKKNIFKGFLDDYISGPFYVHGGPISDRELSKQQIDEIIEYIKATFKHYNSMVIRGNPFNHDIIVHGFQKVNDSNYVVELFKYNNEIELLKSYSKRQRTYVNKAKESSLIIKEASSLNEYEKFYELYQKSIKYWHEDFASYPLKLFQNLYNQKNKYMRFLAIYNNKKMIGGEIAFYWNAHCSSWLAYYNREYSKLNAQRYSIHLDYLYCIEKGIKYYDLGNCGGIKGLQYFKESMGGKAYPYCVWLKENKFLKKIRFIKKKMKFF